MDADQQTIAAVAGIAGGDLVYLPVSHDIA